MPINISKKAKLLLKFTSPVIVWSGSTSKFIETKPVGVDAGTIQEYCRMSSPTGGSAEMAFLSVTPSGVVISISVAGPPFVPLFSIGTMKCNSSPAMALNPYRGFRVMDSFPRSLETDIPPGLGR